MQTTIGHLRLTIGTVVHIRVTLGHLRVTRLFFSISKHKANKTELHPKVRQTCFPQYLNPPILQDKRSFLLDLMDAAGLGTPDPGPEAEMNRTLVFVETKKGADQVSCSLTVVGTMDVLTVVVINVPPRSWTSISTGRGSPSPAYTGTERRRRGKKR